jgi:exonuclease III
LTANDAIYVLCGDINIAHTEADLKNWRGNKKNSAASYLKSAHG